MPRYTQKYLDTPTPTSTMKRPDITPGPWFVTQAANKPVKIETITCRRVCTMADTPEDQREAKARAQAIAALPDLMQALEKCHAFMLELQKGGYCIDCDHEKDTAQEALTKAGYTF